MPRTHAPTSPERSRGMNGSVNDVTVVKLSMVSALKLRMNFENGRIAVWKCESPTGLRIPAKSRSSMTFTSLGATAPRL